MLQKLYYPEPEDGTGAGAGQDWTGSTTLLKGLLIATMSYVIIMVNTFCFIFIVDNFPDLDISTLQPKMSKKVKSRSSFGGGGFSGSGQGGAGRSNEKQSDGPPVELENQVILRYQYYFRFGSIFTESRSGQKSECGSKLFLNIAWNKYIFFMRNRQPKNSKALDPDPDLENH